MDAEPSEPNRPACLICGAPAVATCALCKRPACGEHCARHFVWFSKLGSLLTGTMDRITCDQCCPLIPGSKPTLVAMFFGLLVAAAAALFVALFTFKPWR